MLPEALGLAFPSRTITQQDFVDVIPRVVPTPTILREETQS